MAPSASVGRPSCGQLYCERSLEADEATHDEAEEEDNPLTGLGILEKENGVKLESTRMDKFGVLE